MISEILLQQIDTLTQGVVQRDLELRTLRLTIEKLKIELIIAQAAIYFIAIDRAAYTSVPGSVTQTSSPGCALRTLKRPPCASATSLHRYSPRPTPPSARERAASGR
jgi:hypothetical protein